MSTEQEIEERKKLELFYARAAGFYPAALKTHPLSEVAPVTINYSHGQKTEQEFRRDLFLYSALSAASEAGPKVESDSYKGDGSTGGLIIFPDCTPSGPFVGRGKPGTYHGTPHPWSISDLPPGFHYTGRTELPTPHNIPGGYMSFEALKKNGVNPFLAESLIEGSIRAFGNPADPRTRFVVVPQCGCRDCASKHGEGKAIDFQILDRFTGKLVGGTNDIMQNAFNNPYTFRMFEAVVQGAYQHALLKYGQEAANHLTSGLYFHAMQGGFDNMHISLDEGYKGSDGRYTNRYGSILTGLNNDAGKYIKDMIAGVNGVPSAGMGNPYTWVSEFHPDYHKPEQQVAQTQVVPASAPLL